MTANRRRSELLGPPPVFCRGDHASPASYLSRPKYQSAFARITTAVVPAAPLAAIPERSPLVGHIHALDGVRGLAVAAVMVFHFVAHGPGYAAWPTWFRNTALAGWVGVDVFFVLSGFLITRILLTLRGRPGALRVFYVRRALRIFPLYYAVVAGAAAVLLVRSRLHPLPIEWWNLAAVATYLTNFNVAAQDWGAATFRSVQLTHLWTLAIEEQFYLLWPVIVLYLPKRWTLIGCVGMIVLAPAIRVLMMRGGADITDLYVLTPGRVDSLAWGALIAIVELIRPDSLRPLAWTLLVAGVLCVAAIGGINHTVYEHAPAVQRFGYTALAVASAGAIGLCAAHALPGGIRRLLAARPLTAVGRYGYAIYLFHLPLRGLASATWHAAGDDVLTLPQAIASTVVLVLASVGLAVLSFWSFERWFLRLKPSAPPPG